MYTHVCVYVYIYIYTHMFSSTSTRTNMLAKSYHFGPVVTSCLTRDVGAAACALIEYNIHVSW